jgi:ribosomal protein L32
MSKGSSPRPFSVSQEEFGNRFETIFGKKKVAQQDCACYNCQDEAYRMSHMIVCPTCGNKRCPHATDHNQACTNSNEPGQPGSRY